MKRLANMPTWVQILSIGSFMFASGVLMTWLPFAPAFILLVFGLIKNICPKRFGIWFLFCSAIGILFASAWAISHFSGLAMVSVREIAITIYVIAFIIIIPVLVFALGTIIRLGQWFLSMQWLVSQKRLAISIFAIGIGYGVFSWVYFGMSFSGYLNVIVWIIICASSIDMIRSNWRIGIVVAVVFWCLGLLIMINHEFINTIKDTITIDKITHNYNNQLVQAVYSGDIKRVETLLEKGADVNSRDMYRRPVLVISAETGNIDITKLLFEKGADINASGEEALHYASIYGQTGTMKLLLESGVNVNATAYGETALMVAAHSGQTSAINLLFEKGANINAKTDDGTTALMKAAEYCRKDAVNLLLKLGVDVNMADNNGNTALSTARKAGCADLPELLEAAGAKE